MRARGGRRFEEGPIAVLQKERIGGRQGCARKGKRFKCSGIESQKEVTTSDAATSRHLWATEELKNCELRNS